MKQRSYKQYGRRNFTVQLSFPRLVYHRIYVCMYVCVKPNTNGVIFFFFLDKPTLSFSFDYHSSVVTQLKLEEDGRAWNARKAGSLSNPSGCHFSNSQFHARAAASSFIKFRHYTRLLALQKKDSAFPLYIFSHPPLKTRLLNYLSSSDFLKFQYSYLILLGFRGQLS